MTEKKPEDAPVYPNITPDMPIDGSPGMSLRDYFAGQALGGLVFRGLDTNTTTRMAHRYADAMIAERDK